MVDINVEDLGFICAGRKCSKKKECLRYRAYYDDFNIGKFIPLAVNHCNYDGKLPNLIEYRPLT